MEVNRINHQTSFKSFYLESANGFRNLSRKGNPVSEKAVTKNILKHGFSNAKIIGLITTPWENVLLTSKEAQAFSKIKSNPEKLNFLNSYLKRFGIEKQEIKVLTNGKFDTYSSN